MLRAGFLLKDTLKILQQLIAVHNDYKRKSVRRVTDLVNEKVIETYSNEMPWKRRCSEEEGRAQGYVAPSSSAVLLYIGKKLNAS